MVLTTGTDIPSSPLAFILLSSCHWQPRTNSISFFPAYPGMQASKLSINRRHRCGIPVPPLMYRYTREGGNRHRGPRKQELHFRCTAMCQYNVNLCRASTQVLSLSLHCYYRVSLLLIITFLWLQHSFSSLLVLLLRIPFPDLNTPDRLLSPQGCQDW